MTLDELNAHLVLIQELTAAKDLLRTLEAAALSASKLDAIPRATGAGDRTAALAVKIVQQRQVVQKYQYIAEASAVTVKAWIGGIEDNRLNVIFYLRFICGYEWLEVADMTGSTENAVKSLAYRYFRSQAL